MVRVAVVMVMVMMVWARERQVVQDPSRRPSSNIPTWTSTTHPTSLNWPSIAYKHNPALGDFIVARGWAVDDPEAISDIIHTRSRCEFLYFAVSFLFLSFLLLHFA